GLRIHPRRRSSSSLPTPLALHDALPIFSTVARTGLNELRFALMDIVREHRKKVEDTPEPQQVIRPQSVGPKRKGRFADFEVHEDKHNPGAFVVTGQKIDRWILQTDFENDEAIGFLADRLAKAGVEEALWQAGAVDGSEVTIGGITFEWDPQSEAGVDQTPAYGRGKDRLQ